jgi:6-phosphogluconolactonase (cycloisomerase 2 family)
VAAGRDTAIPAIHPGGRFLYAPNAGSNDVSGYSIDGSGRLTALVGSPFSAGVGPVALAIAPFGRAAYVLNGLESTVSAFGIDATTGALRPLAASLPAGGTAGGSGAIAVDPSGRFAYAAAFTSGSVAAFAVDSSTGDLRPVANATITLARPVALAVTHARQ